MCEGISFTTISYREEKNKNHLESSSNASAGQITSMQTEHPSFFGSGSFSPSINTFLKLQMMISDATVI